MALIVICVLGLACLVAVSAFTPMARTAPGQLAILAAAIAIIAALLIAFIPLTSRPASTESNSPALSSPTQSPSDSGPTQAQPTGSSGNGPAQVQPTPTDVGVHPPTPTINSGGQNGLSAEPQNFPSQTQPAAPVRPILRSPTRGGVSVIVEDLNEFSDKYIATLRIQNDNPNDIGIGVLASSTAFAAEGYLNDDRGGSCQMISNGDSFGTLSSIHQGNGGYVGQFSIIPAGSQSRHNLFFNKFRCVSLIQTRAGAHISLRVVFVISNNGNIFLDPVQV